MKRYLEKFLTSVLLGTCILLCLSFWLNIRFRFNLFCLKHWDELAKLQTSSNPHINKVFYVSIGISLFAFIAGLYIIYRPRLRKISNNQPVSYNNIQTDQNQTNYTPQPSNAYAMTLQRPPKLDLPKNMATVAAQTHAQQQSPQQQQIQQPVKHKQQPTIFDDQLTEIFTNGGYIVKPNLTISGFTTNLFAIGTNELAWIGAVDCDINTLKNASNRLQSLFKETLEDIPIHVSAFMLDTKNIYNSDDTIMIFHTINEIQSFIQANQNPELPESEIDNFNAYSDYIDTIIQYAKNI